MPKPERQFRLADIEVKRGTRNESIARVFTFESTARGKRGPIGLVVAEIYSTLYVYEQLLEVIEQTAEQTHMATLGVDTDPMARFEKMVQRVNDRVTEFLKQEPSPVAWGRVNIFLLELSDGHVSVSGIGHLSNIFLQKQPNGEMRGFDLLSSLEQPETINPEKPFASILCGDMNAGDVLFIGTQNFEHVRQAIGMIKTLSTEPPVSAGVLMKKAIEQEPITETFHGVIISSIELSLPDMEAPSSDSSSEEDKGIQSVIRLHEEEQKTETMLSPTITPLPFGFASQEEASPDRLPFYTRLKQSFVRTQTALWDWLEDRKRKPTIQDPIALASLRGMNAGHGSFMTPERKRMIMGFGVGILTLVLGVAWYRHAQTVAQEQALWKTVYDEVQDKKNRAEADLVYGNDDRAQSLVKESMILIDGMKIASKDQTKAVEDLRASFATLLAKIKHETVLTNLTEVHAIGTQDTVASIASAYDALYLLDPVTRTVTSVANDGTKRSIPIPTSFGSPGMLVGTKDILYLLTDEGTAYLLKPNGSFSSVPFEVRSNTSSTIASTIYNKRLYRIDAPSRTVWKHAPKENGFGAGTTYVKQHDTDITDANGIAIDTNVYLTTKRGSLVRFLSGQEEVWIARATEPRITTLAGIWTSPELENIYVTDPEHKRIIAYRKSDGKLMDQFSSTEWQSPTLITGNASKKILYVTDRNRVIKINLP